MAYTAQSRIRVEGENSAGPRYGPIGHGLLRLGSTSRHTRKTLMPITSKQIPATSSRPPCRFFHLRIMQAPMPSDSLPPPLDTPIAVEEVKS